MSDSAGEATARAFFAAMNAQDGDAAAALTRADVRIALGPNRLSGHAAVRELAAQTHVELTFETSPRSFQPAEDGVLEVVAERVQRWRSTGDVAAVEDLRVRFTFDADGSIATIDLS